MDSQAGPSNWPRAYGSSPGESDTPHVQKLSTRQMPSTLEDKHHHEHSGNDSHELSSSNGVMRGYEHEVGNPGLGIELGDGLDEEAMNPFGRSQRKKHRIEPEPSSTGMDAEAEGVTDKSALLSSDPDHSRSPLRPRPHPHSASVSGRSSRRTSNGAGTAGAAAGSFSRGRASGERYRERDRLRGHGHGHEYENAHGHTHGQGLGMASGPVLSVEQRKALWWRDTLITGVFILSWYTFATLLSLYNKWMFSPEYYGFSYPLFVTFCHMVVQFILASIIRTVWAERYRPKERPTRREYVMKIFPTALSTGGDIGLSNLSLKTITLSLYTMCKSSTLVFVLGFAFLFRLEKYSFRLVAVVLLITFGVFLMVLDTTAVNIPGIVMVFSASALSGLRWALTETVMHKQSMGLSNPFATIFWLAPISAVVLAIVSIGLEGWGTIFGSAFFEGFTAVKTLGFILFPGALAFSMVASEYFIIQRAGIIPLSIAGMFKEVSTISISALVFGDQLTPVNIGGVAIAVLGIALYTYHKYQKSIAPPDPALVDARGKVFDAEYDRLDDLEYTGTGSIRSFDYAAAQPYATAGGRSSLRSHGGEEDGDEESLPITPGLQQSGVPMTALDTSSSSTPRLASASISATGSRSATPPPLRSQHNMKPSHKHKRSSKSKVKTRTEKISAYPPKPELGPGDSAGSGSGSESEPEPESESAIERRDRLVDEFEGWGDRDWSEREDEESEDEMGDEEVARRMSERNARGDKGRWGEWWDRSM